MKWIRVLTALVAGFFLAGLSVAQEKPRASSEQKSATPLKVQLVFTETEGEKKTSSLPYTLLVTSIGGPDRPTRPSSLRMGLRVPIMIEGKDSKVQYMDVGTYIDCQAFIMEDGRHQLHLSFERSSIFPTGTEKKAGGVDVAVQPSNVLPMFQNFRGSLVLLMQDSQTVQSVVATDPLTGRMLRLDVTMSVVK